MLAQFVQRKVAKEQSRKASNSRSFLLAASQLCVFALSVFLFSCRSTPADLRSFIPADSLIYLESNDLGAVMNTITDRPAFREAAKAVPDFSVLNGVKLAVAVTGFETKEEKITDENSVLNFQPRFIAILETNAWNYQALAFTEHKLGEFINNVYGGEVELNTSDKSDGKYFVWTAKDGRKAFAFVQGSLVFFGNDETALEKSIAVKRGEAESIAKNAKITDGDRLAFGYVSPDGVAQIANVIGVKYASDASDEQVVQGLIAGALPKLIRNTFTDISWSAVRSREGIEDKFSIGVAPETADIFDETLAVDKEPDNDLFRLTPENFISTTRYNFRNARIAWRTVVLTAAKSLGDQNSSLVRAFANSLFEPYGIEDPEMFLGSAGNTIQTFDLGNDNANVGVAVRVSDEAVLKKSLSRDIDFSKSPEVVVNTKVWRSADRQLAAAILGHVSVGSGEVVDKCLLAENEGKQLVFTDQARIGASTAPIVTLGRDVSSTRTIVELLSELNDRTSTRSADYLTETRFNKNGIERRTVSDFGFIGWIFTQFADKEE